MEKGFLVQYNSDYQLSNYAIKIFDKSKGITGEKQMYLLDKTKKVLLLLLDETPWIFHSHGAKIHAQNRLVF